MPSATLPDFPDGLPETTLARLSLAALLAHDAATEARLVAVCQSHGFFYLDLADSDPGAALLADAAALHALAERAFALPQPDKDAISFARTRSLFGYKPPGAVAKADAHARRDRGEFFNLAKDDLVANPGRPDIAYPGPLGAAAPLACRFAEAAHAVGLAVLAVLAAALGVPPAALLGRHRLAGLSGDHIRLTYGPGDAAAAAGDEGKAERDVRITTFAHTDFGSVTLLFNWLGGLQIEDADVAAWRWVRPRPGCAIVNLGDAMVEFTGGRVRSGKHRVVSAPGLQARLDRYSVVYFVRPEDEVLMEDLTQDARGKDGARRAVGTTGGHRWKAKDWITQRAKDLGNKMSDED